MKKSIPSDFKIKDFADITDVRDGLNPSLRIMLFVLKSMFVDDKLAKSSHVLKGVADIIGIDFELIYDVLVDTTWPRSDLPYIIGHGNFGFPPAYPDFSEMKLSSFGKIIVGRANDSDFNLPFTVPIPYALACGTIGYCQCETKIPSHNLAEVIDAMIALVKNPDLETKDLLQFIKGPDLLIGGAIENPEELCSIYEKGFGNVKVIVTPQNFNMSFIGRVSDYCNWYQLKFRKVYIKETYRIELPYYAFMSDGKDCKLMSLKDILKKHLDHYRAYKSELSNDELCDVLASLKEDSSVRKIWEKV